ncbi:hypothetical protein [Tritonibacter mobilis]|uniref:hypothetical protein n=1 Tax=Tritonibacter mobilis TaxID=379347 RepID=UPI00080686EF|nr:hypothetical protein [Tritonibacter mobilis]
MMNRLKKIAIWIAGAMLALLTAYQVGRMKEDYDDTIEDFEKDKEATKRVIQTDINTDSNAALERLRKTGRLRD